MHKFLLLYSWLVRTALIILPDIPFIMRFRGWLYSFGIRKCGSDFQVSANVIIKNLENLEIGSNVYVAPNVVINAIGTITLNNQVMVGFNSVLVSGNHTMSNGSFRYGVSSIKPIVIGEGAWVSANCTVIAGAILPASSILAANSVLSKSYTSERRVFGGVPAKEVSQLN